MKILFWLISIPEIIHTFFVFFCVYVAFPAKQTLYNKTTELLKSFYPWLHKLLGYPSCFSGLTSSRISTNMPCREDCALFIHTLILCGSSALSFSLPIISSHLQQQAYQSVSCKVLLCALFNIQIKVVVIISGIQWCRSSENGIGLH